MEGYLRIHTVHIFKNNISLIKEQKHVKYITSCDQFSRAIFQPIKHLSKHKSKYLNAT